MMSSAVLDVTSILFAMRVRVYMVAWITAGRYRSVIVVVDADKFHRG